MNETPSTAVRSMPCSAARELEQQWRNAKDRVERWLKEDGPEARKIVRMEDERMQRLEAELGYVPLNAESSDGSGASMAEAKDEQATRQRCERTAEPFAAMTGSANLAPETKPAKPQTL